MEFCEWVRKERKRFLMTQKELAEAVGLSRVTINRIEREMTTPDMQTIRLIRTYFTERQEHKMFRKN